MVVSSLGNVIDNPNSLGTMHAIQPAKKFPDAMYMESQYPPYVHKRFPLDTV